MKKGEGKREKKGKKSDSCSLVYLEEIGRKKKVILCLDKNIYYFGEIETLIKNIYLIS